MPKTDVKRNFYDLPVQERHDMLVDAYARMTDIPKENILKDLQKQTGDDVEAAYNIALNDACGWIGIDPEEIDTVASLEKKVGELVDLSLSLKGMDLTKELDDALESLRKINISRLNNPALMGTDELSKLQHDFYKGFSGQRDTDTEEALCALARHYAELGIDKRLDLLSQARSVLYGENPDHVSIKFLRAAPTPQDAIRNLSVELQACLKDTHTASPLDDMIEYAASLTPASDYMLESVIGVIVKKIKAMDGPDPEPAPIPETTHTISSKPQ